MDELRQRSRGIPNVDLARLNLRVGKPLSRMALELPDDDSLVALAQRIVNEILSGGERG